MNQQQYSPIDDSELTLATPHFTVQEAQAARPVVPLAQATNTGSFGAPFGSVNSQGRRSWPLFLIIISAVLGGVAGGFALSFYQGRQASSAIAPTVTTTDKTEVLAPPVSTTTETSHSTPPQADSTVTATTDAPIASTSSRATRTEVAGETTDAKRNKANRTDARRKATTSVASRNGAPSRNIPGQSDETIARSERRSSDDRDDDSDREDEERIERRHRRAERRTNAPDAIDRAREAWENRARIREGIRDIFEGRQPQ